MFKAGFPKGKVLRWGIIILTPAILTIVFLNLAGAAGFVRTLTAPPCPAFAPPVDWPGFREVWLEVADERLVRAWYFPGSNQAAVILMGGSSGSLGDQLPISGALRQAGFGVLEVDTRACARPAGRVTLGILEIQEIKAGIDFLVAQPEVNPGRLGIYGFSMGGVAAVRAAARLPGISAVVAEGGYYNLGDDFTEPGSLQPWFVETVQWSTALVFWWVTGENPWLSSPVDDLPRISPRPVFLIYGEGEVGSARAEEQFAAAHEPKSFWIVPGGNHGINFAVAGNEYLDRITNFFVQSLLSDQ